MGSDSFSPAPQASVPQSSGPFSSVPQASGPQASGPQRGSTSFGLAFLRLFVVLGAGIGLAIALHAVGVLVVVIALVAMVMAHELGHFATAKACGMKVTEYFFGFGPRLWSVRKGETEYGVKLLPAGGYVKITGMTMLEEVSPSDEARSYRQATFPRRVLVASAGSLVHLLLAFVLVWCAFVFVGWPDRASVVGMLSFKGTQTPAQLAGLRPGDQILSVDGQRVSSVDALISEVNASTGKTLRMVVDRHGHQLDLTVTPVNGKDVTVIGADQYNKSEGVIGVSLDYAIVPVNPLVAVQRSGAELGSLVAGTSQSLAQVFSIHGLLNFGHQVATAGNHNSSTTTGSASSSNTSSSGTVISLLGVIQIGSQLSIGNLLLLLAEINLFIGIVNLFPMLPLDGGHVAIAVYERLRSWGGRRYHADVAKLLPVAYVFLAFIVLFGLGALYANIVQPVHLPGG